MSFWSGGDDDGASVTGYAPSDPRGWTDVIPPALVAAAAEEESYLAAQDEHSQTSSDPGYAPAPGQGNGPVTPHIPPAPGLPRFLEKLILNTRPTGANIAGRDRTAERQRTRARDAAKESGGAHDGIPVTTASGTDISSRGVMSGLSAMSPAHTGGSHSGGPTSPGTPPVPGAGATGSVAQPPTRRPTGMPRLEVNVDAAPGTFSGAGTAGSGGSAGLGRPRSHSTAAPPVQHSAGSSGAVHAVADDASVLPVPSHVILHHLCTSAIRDGVLAVANTTRYRKKYLTTIYYKPT
jgi:hypothetical protein